MNTFNFCDTSAIVKLYHHEVGSEWMEAIFNDANAIIVISELTHVEFYSAMLKKVRTGDITNEAKEEAIKNFEKYGRDKFMLTLLESRIFKKAQKLLDKYGRNYSLRTLDAIQLAACLHDKIDGIRFIGADVHLLKICELEGLNMINPETEGDRC